MAVQQQSSWHNPSLGIGRGRIDRHRLQPLQRHREDPLGGTTASAYLAQVPFEDASVDYTSTAGPSASSYIMCMTCHRAHASSAPDAGRWDFSVTLLVDDGVESGSYPLPDPYASLAQRSLCNKCHVKDEFDHVP